MDVTLRKTLTEYLSRVEGLCKIFITDRDGVAISQVSLSGYEGLIRPALLGAHSSALEQCAKLGIDCMGIVYSLISAMTSPLRRAAFDVVHRCRALDKIPVVKYRSPKTGLRVTIADVESPIVKGYFCLATEDSSDDGLPHTLEHLVFMGSKRYPFKGVLDVVANRCLASGTNAWTEQDHTCYTLDTAGEDGFLKLLPIYLEHILDPTLTLAQYVTEVHHITGEGQDAGVVYSEMQEYESSMDEIVNRAVKKALYPEGCGYRSETGGRVGNLRTSCSHEKVRAFHDKFYCAQNLNVIIVGKIDHASVFNVIEPVEQYLMQSKPVVCARAFSRPFTGSIAPLESTTERRLLCPVDDQSAGVVDFSWRGPAAKNVYEVTAFHILNTYLTDSAVSPFEKDFVQIEKPLCSSICSHFEENWVCRIGYHFSGVPVQKLNEIKPTLEKCIEKLTSSEGAIDIQRMRDIIRQTINRAYSQLESNPHHAVADSVIGDFLYGFTEKDFEERMNSVSIYKRLKGEPAAFWGELIRKYMDKGKPVVVIIGEPNAKVAKQQTEQEGERLQKQKETLGEEGLEKCGEEVEAAIEQNESGAPGDELLERCIVNSVDSVCKVHITASTNRCLDEDSNATLQLSGIPFTTILSDCNTNFVQFCMMVDTSKMHVNLRKYLLLWTDVMFESGVVRDGKVVPYQDVVKEINRDLVNHSAGISFKRMLAITVKVAAEDYMLGINWMKDFLTGLHVDRDRLLVVVKKLLNAIPSMKSDGHTVASFLHKFLCFEKDSNTVLKCLLHQAKFLEELKKELENDPKDVLEVLNKLKNLLADDNQNFVLHVVCNAKLLPKDAGGNFQSLSVEGNGSKGKAVVGVAEPSHLVAESQFGRGLITPIAACESAYFMQSATSINSYACADIPAIELCLQYLLQCEGPVWRQVRGQGFAYGAHLTVNPWDGLITLELYRSSQLLQAYHEIKTIIEDHVDGKEEIDEDEWEGARRSLVFEIIEREKDVHSASDASLKAYFRDVPHDYNKQLLDKVWKLDSEEAWKKAGPYLKTVFDWKKCNTAITCHPSKTDELVKEFTK